MAWRFKRISTRDDALGLIGTYCVLFYFFAATQVVVGGLIWFASPSVRGFAGVPPEAAFDYFATAAVFIILTVIVRELRSRIAAVLLLLMSIAVAATSIAYKASNQTSGNFYFALIAIWGAARLVEATFRLNGQFARVSAAPSKPETPPHDTADFIHHPRAGVESTAATAKAEAQSAPPQYDKEKWAALLKYDDEIAIVAGRISVLGQRWVDEFARAYLTLNDKSYLRRIEEKIRADARADYARSKL
jgi:hypothetical protein